MAHATPAQQDMSMGRVTANVKLTNYADAASAEQGYIDRSAVRETEVEYFVDTGAAHLSLPRTLIQQLGLDKIDERPVVTANGRTTRSVYGPVRFEVTERAEITSVMKLPEDAPPLLGYLPLEIVDLQPSPKTQRLEGNPEHNGEWVMDHSCPSVSRTMTTG